MSQIMYNYPAMLAHAADMAGYAGTLQGLGADIASEQAALQAGWQGDTGMSYQAWQAQWNQAMEQLVLAYRAMAGTHDFHILRRIVLDLGAGKQLLYFGKGFVDHLLQADGLPLIGLTADS